MTFPAATADRPFALPPRELITTTIDLPTPPSVNRTRKIDWRMGRQFKGWTRDADALILAARCRSAGLPRLQKVTGRFELKIVLSESHTGIDLDNGIKWLIDYLRRIDLITDDSPKYMRRLTVEWGLAPQGARLTITGDGMSDDRRFQRLPQRVKAVIEKVNGGQKLCKSLRLKEGGETEITYVFEPSGRRCGPKSANAAIHSGFLAPAGDGLFGLDYSQTWTAA